MQSAFEEFSRTKDPFIKRLSQNTPHFQFHLGCVMGADKKFPGNA